MTARIGALEDLAILTGAQVFSSTANDSISNVKLEDLGRARRIWANMDNFGIVGGRGDPRRLREHIAGLRQGYANIKDVDDRKKILQRLGKLMGGSATLWVGDLTPNAVEVRKDIASRAAEAMRGAMRDGVVPGGGVALLNCRGALREAMQDFTDPDEIAAYRILIKALEQPFRVLVENAGLDLDEVAPAVKMAGPGFGYDVVRHEVVDMIKANIYDVAPVVKAAVYAAINGAALALTTDVVIHRKNPPESLATTS
jgi:chaperonin GroEL